MRTIERFTGSAYANVPIPYDYNHNEKIRDKTSRFLSERSESPNERGYYPYKHRNVRGAYTSLKRYQDYLRLRNTLN